MKRNLRQYTANDIARVRQMRAEGCSFKEIGTMLNVTAAAIRNAMLYRDGATGAYAPDRMPKRLRAWPPGVDFSPDELELRA